MTDSENDSSDPMTPLQLQFTDEIDTEESIIVSDDGLVAWLRDTFGDELRVVGAYNEHTFEVLHVTPVVREQYTDQEFTATGDDFVLRDRKEDPYLERLYHLGAFTYDVQGFEDGQVIRIPLGETNGVLFSVDRTATVTLPQLVNQLTRRHDVVFR